MLKRRNHPRRLKKLQRGFIALGLGIGPAFNGQWNPSTGFFEATDPGDWWDASDLPLMYQDAAGTTAAEVNQPVGLMLGQRYKGQRGAELVVNGGFDSSDGWSLGTGWSISGGQAIHSAASGAGVLTQAGGLTVGKWYEATFDRIDAGASALNVQLGNSTFISTGAGAGTKRCIGICAGSTSLGLQGGGDYVVDNFSIREVPGIHRYQTTSANRPTLKQDANGKYYLSYNGTNSWMQTSAVDFSGTDKITVVGAWTKLSDATAGFCRMVEFGDAVLNAGSFALNGPATIGTATYEVALRGTATTAFNVSGSGMAAPTTKVLSASLDIAGASRATEIYPRVNGALPTLTGTGAADAGGGNFGNYPLYFGARAGTSLFFNGNEYISAIAGAAKTETLIARMERYAAGKAGLSL